MTARDTHELRLDRWPRLSTLPTTNAFIALVMVLWGLTGLCALTPWKTLEPPDRWYQALEVLTGIVVVQFAAKRATDTTLWQRGKKEGNGGTAG